MLFLSVLQKFELLPSVEEFPHLLPRFFQRSRVINFVGGQAAFFLIGQLRGNSLPRITLGHAARLQARKLLGFAAPNDRDAIQLVMNAGLDEQRGFQHRDAVRMASLPFRELPVVRFDHAGMNHLIQPRKLGSVGKNNGRKIGAIHAAIRVADAGAKFFQDFIIRRIARLD